LKLPRSDDESEGRRKNCYSFCKRVFNLRSCQLRLTLGRTPLYSLFSRILVCESQPRYLNAIGQKKASPHSLAITIDTHRTERRADVNMSH
jgi:hypothetical protein